MEINHEGTDEITCPWCGYKSLDSWEHTHNEGEEECANCGKQFEWQRDITVDYSTSKK